jgi:rubredoxin
MECRICWHVYDPALGDELGQIAPGAPFDALPPHWRCPRCDAPKESFLECA